MPYPRMTFMCFICLHTYVINVQTLSLSLLNYLLNAETCCTHFGHKHVSLVYAEEARRWYVAIKTRVVYTIEADERSQPMSMPLN